MNYYVSIGGDDLADGSLFNPFATLTRAMLFASAGDVVFMRGGTHTSYVVMANGGNSQQVVTVTPYNAEPVTIRPNPGLQNEAVYISAANVVLDRVVVDGVNRLKGIAIGGHHVTINNAEVMNCIGASAGRYGQGIIVNDSAAAHHVTIDYCRIHDVDGIPAESTFCHAVYAACVGLIVRNTEAYNIGGHGVHWYASQGGDAQVYNNYFHDAHVGVGIYQSRALVYNNVIRDTIQAFIARYGVINALFLYNTCINNFIGIDIAELATLPDPNATVTIEAANNIFSTGSFAVHTEQLNPATAKVNVHHNLRFNQTLADALVGNVGAWYINHINGSASQFAVNAAGIAIPSIGNFAIRSAIPSAWVGVDRAGLPRGNTPTIGAFEPIQPTYQPRLTNPWGFNHE